MKFPSILQLFYFEKYIFLLLYERIYSTAFYIPVRVHIHTDIIASRENSPHLQISKYVSGPRTTMYSFFFVFFFVFNKMCVRYAVMMTFYFHAQSDNLFYILCNYLHIVEISTRAQVLTMNRIRREKIQEKFVLIRSQNYIQLQIVILNELRYHC